MTGAGDGADGQADSLVRHRRRRRSQRYQRPEELYGLRQQDRLFGNGGSDVLLGAHGYDILYGGADRDIIFSGLHDDRIFGDAGDDRIDGGRGADQMTGGLGDDRFDIIDGGDKTIFDFNTRAGENDEINLKKFFDSLGQLAKSSQVVEIDGITSTRIVYIAEKEQTTLTLMGYDIKSDGSVDSHFII